MGIRFHRWNGRREDPEYRQKCRGSIFKVAETLENGEEVIKLEPGQKPHADWCRGKLEGKEAYKDFLKATESPASKPSRQSFDAFSLKNG